MQIRTSKISKLAIQDKPDTKIEIEIPVISSLTEVILLFSVVDHLQHRTKLKNHILEELFLGAKQMMMA